MSMVGNGGPAFPARNYVVPYDLEARHVHALGATQGMTLRDYFAAKAMQGMLAATSDGDDWPIRETIAAVAYAQADAMLKAREAQP